MKILTQTMRICCVLFCFLSISSLSFGAEEKNDSGKIRIGVIGTTTSHVPAALGLMNVDNPKNVSPEMAELFKEFKITAAYKGGMPDNESGWSRRDKYADNCIQKGVTIYPTIEAMLPHVDCVLLESVDGRPHLEQATPVILAKKPLFIDKPMAGSLADVLEIFRLANENQTPVFSASSLRYGDLYQRVRKESENGKITIWGCDTCTPASMNNKHPDLYWYAIHGVEPLFTVMGPKCISVSRTKTEHTDFVVGIWEGERIGTMRGIRKGKSIYDGTRIFTGNTVEIGGKYQGYAPLFFEICKFFKTGKSPIAQEETIAILTFMSAADESWKQGGKHILMKDVLEKARQEKRVRVELTLDAQGNAQWNREPIALEKIEARVTQTSADGSVVRVILNNRAGAPFEIVQKVTTALDKAYLANYLY